MTGPGSTPATRGPGGTLAVWGSVALVGIGAALIAVLSITGDLNTSLPPVTTIIGLIVTGVGALSAAGFSRQASHDIRNGVVLEKAAQGARQALDETGVTAVAQGAGSANALAMQALAAILERNTAATETNTAQHAREEGN